MVDISFSSYIALTSSINGVIGSSSFDTKLCITSSLIMKFVAEVSSSISKRFVFDSIASTILAACDVLPLAFSLINLLVSLPFGRLFINNDISSFIIDLPSSALTFIEVLSAITYSLPSPSM